MEEWKEYKLGDLYEVHNGLSKGGNFFGSGYPFLSFSTVFKNFFLPQSLDSLVLTTEKERSNFDIKRGDVFITRTSETAEELGMSSVALKDYPDATYNGFTKRLRPINGENVVVPEYIGYYLRSPKFRGLFYGLSSSMSTRASLANGDLLNMKVYLPSLKEQKKIASILKSLDDKIENNRKINENLEQQAQALFKSWFVDFEPFRDQPFVESELGMIPEGWRVGVLNELGYFINGYPFKSESFVSKGRYKVITIKSVQDGNLSTYNTSYIDELPSNIKAECILSLGDILLSLTGNVGRCCLVDENCLLLNQRVAKIVPTQISSKSFVYAYFRRMDTQKTLISIARGTAQANLSPTETGNLKLVIPPKQIIDNYSTIASKLLLNIIELKIENSKLSQIRDTLLPRLMSGELSIY